MYSCGELKTMSDNHGNNIWFTSDTHFKHGNILKHCPNRKFSTIDEHDTHLIKMWNYYVKPKDTIFHCGDFAFGVVEDSYSILDSLNGNKILITGNHDSRHLKREQFRSRFKSIKYGYYELETRFNGSTVLAVMCHFPIESWNKMRYGSFMLHGHCHTSIGENTYRKLKLIPNRKDIGVDSKVDHSPWEKVDLFNTILKEFKSGTV